MNEDVSLEPFEMEGKYLTFNLMEEYYGVGEEWILQIIAIPSVTVIPKTPHYVKGVINLRGKIIPVIDLRLKFNMVEQKYHDRTSVVIIRIKSENGEIYIGIIVDQVNEVFDIHKEEIEKAPVFGVDFETQFILAMAKIKGKVVTLLNFDKILTEA